MTAYDQALVQPGDARQGVGTNSRRRRRSRADPARCSSSRYSGFSREAMREPSGEAPSCAGGGRLSCVGYGSAVTVTASFGLAAAAEALALLAG